MNECPAFLKPDFLLSRTGSHPREEKKYQVERDPVIQSPDHQGRKGILSRVRANNPTMKNAVKFSHGNCSLSTLNTIIW